MNNPTKDTTPSSPPPGRILSVDVFRGTVMFLMCAEALELCHAHEKFPTSRILEFLCFHQSHVAWRGCSIHDLIQPGFSFLVGTALAFSVSNRRSKNQSSMRIYAHVAWRALVLILLGVFLRSLGRSQTYWTFEDTLTQIGLGYLPLFIISLFPRKATWAAFAVLVLGYFAAFALTPLPGEGFDTTTVGVSADWEHWEEGFAAHWNKNTNLAMKVDKWFLNLFPRESPFEYNGGGYATLSFIPTLATMLLGLVAGRWLVDEKQHGDRKKTFMFLVAAAAICLLVGYGLDWTGLCISVKRIWTPAWVFVSGGWCFLILAVLHYINDIVGIRKPFFPFVVFGMNSLAAYLLAHGRLFRGFVRDNVERHLPWLEKFGDLVAGVAPALIYLTLMWLILLWLYRKRLFLKI